MISYKLNAPINGILSSHPAVSSIEGEIILIKQFIRGVKLELNEPDINN